MTQRGGTRLVLVAVIWILLVAGAAVVYRFAIAPSVAGRADVREARQAWAEVASRADARGMTYEPLPDEAAAEEIRERAAELTERLTSSAVAATVRSTIRIALDSFSGYAILRSDAFRDALLERGLGLELVDDRADYPARLRAIERGETPLAVFTIDALLKASAVRGDMPATIVMVLGETIGADAMVTREAVISELAQLEGATIVLTPDSPSETLARVVLSSFDLQAVNQSDFEPVGGPRDVYERFLRDDRTVPRAYVLWEPYVSKALEQPGAMILLDSSSFEGYIVDVLVADREWILRHEDDARAVVEAYQEVRHRFVRADGDLASLVRADAAESGEPITARQAEALVDRIWWKNTQENFAHFGLVPASDGGGLPTLDAIIRRIGRVLVRTGAIPDDAVSQDPSRLFYDRPLRAMFEAGFHPGLVRGAGPEAYRDGRRAEPLEERAWDALVPVGAMTVDRIVFARGTERLTGRSELALAELALVLESFPQYYLTVRGHASAVGDPQANRDLARRRAETARDRLMAEGVAPAPAPGGRDGAVAPVRRGAGGILRPRPEAVLNVVSLESDAWRR